MTEAPNVSGPLSEEFQILPLVLDVLSRVKDSENELDVSKAVRFLLFFHLACINQGGFILYYIII
jgi:hypothetical protein